jgi:hypothetical protein
MFLIYYSFWLDIRPSFITTMPGKHPREYSIDEVCLWVFALGLGNKADAFREAAIDGDMLLTLGDEDFKELGLSSLQSKKVMRGIEISTSQSEQGGAGDDSERIKELEAEIVELRAQLEENKKVAAPPPVTAPAPRHDAPPVRAAPPESNEHHVLRGAAGGDAKKGAKIGAATGGAVRGVRGVGRSRRGRMAGKF